MRSTCSTPTASCRAGTPAPSASRATRPAEIIGQHFSRFYTDEDRARRPAASGAAHRRAQKASSRAKAGGCARTAPASGPTWSSIRSAPVTASLLGFAKITRDLTERQAAEESLRAQRAAVPAAGAGRHRLRHLHARSARAVSATGTPAPSASRATGADEIVGQHFSRFYTDERSRQPACRSAASRPPRREGRFEKEGWRRAQGRHTFWAHVGHRRHPRR